MFFENSERLLAVLTTFANHSILDVWEGSGYASGFLNVFTCFKKLFAQGDCKWKGWRRKVRRQFFWEKTYSKFSSSMTICFFVWKAFCSEAKYHKYSKNKESSHKRFTSHGSFGSTKGYIIVESVGIYCYIIELVCCRRLFQFVSVMQPNTFFDYILSWHEKKDKIKYSDSESKVNT